jgi:hypothetical protein
MPNDVVIEEYEGLRDALDTHLASASMAYRCATGSGWS